MGSVFICVVMHLADSPQLGQTKPQALYYLQGAEADALLAAAPPEVKDLAALMRVQLALLAGDSAAAVQLLGSLPDSDLQHRPAVIATLASLQVLTSQSSISYLSCVLYFSQTLCTANYAHPGSDVIAITAYPMSTSSPPSPSFALPPFYPLLARLCALKSHHPAASKGRHTRLIISRLPCWPRTRSCHAPLPRPKARTTLSRQPPALTL